MFLTPCHRFSLEFPLKTSLILLTLTLGGYDELRDNRKDLTATMFQHVMDSLASKELVWVNGLA